MKTRLSTSFWDLYDNCVFAFIEHAVANLRFPEFSYEQSWDGITYCYHFNTLGGTITFDFQNCIVAGAARYDLSNRRLLYENPAFQASDFYNEASPAVKVLAQNEALQYLYDNIDGRTVIIITSAFWGENDEVYAYEGNEDFVKHGGEYILEVLCKDRDKLKERMQEYHGFNSNEEMATVEYIYSCFKNEKLIIPQKEVPLISKRREGYKECLESLNEIGIRIV